MRKLAELCDDAVARALRDQPDRVRERRGRAARGGAEDHREARSCPASSCCTTTCSSWPGRSRSRCEGPDTARALLPPGRGRGSSVSSIVCFLTGLSHVDPIANELLIGRFLNEELKAAARHRPRLPARHPGGADPARPRALRPRPLGAGGGLPDLSRARGDPRARQGAGAAAGGDRAGGARQRGVGRARGGEGHREAFGSGRTASGGTPQLGAVTGVGVAGAAGRRRPTGCRATLSQHSGGMIVATRPLIDCCPIVPAAMEGRQIVAVGQGLLLGRRLPEDRPAGAGDAVGGRALRRDDRAHARRADRPVADPLRRPGDLRVHPGRRHHRGVSDREPRADAVVAAHPAGEPARTSRSRWRSCARARSRAAPSIPTSSGASGCASIPTSRCRTTIPRWSRCCARRWGRSSSRTRCWRSRSPSRASRRARRRGCGGR